MKRREDIDPELHLLKSITNQTQDYKVRHQLEGARFNVFAAFEAGDDQRARQWLRALSAAILGLEGPARQLAEEALGEIQAAVEGQA
jgi:sigma54-dependent transcription regulator